MPPLFPGLFLGIGLSLCALYLGTLFPIVGGAVFGILLGIIVRTLRPIPKGYLPGINFNAKQILQFSIILLGGTLSLGQIVRIGSESFSVLIFTVTVAGITAATLGRMLGVTKILQQLIGVGTAICGGSAIAAVSSVIDADDHDIAYAISTIFLFNVLAVIIFPTLGLLLHMSHYGFGLFAGTAINDTSAVVAAGYTFSLAAGDFATIVKLTRTTLIIPICLFFMTLTMREKKTTGHFDIVKIFPWFILGFLGMAVVNTLGYIPPTLVPLLKDSARFLIILALTAVGLKTDFRKMLETGPKPMLLGLGVWLAVASTSLIVQCISKQL